MRTAAHPRLHRGRFAGVALLCLFGQTCALLHGILVEHARCPEHGEAVHAAADAHVVPYATRATLDGPLARKDADTRAEGHAHDHCLAVAERRAAAIAPDAGGFVPERLSAIVPTTPDQTVRPAARPLFLLAPKTSPPA